MCVSVLGLFRDTIFGFPSDLDNTVVSILCLNADKGDYVLETLRIISESVQSLSGLDVCIYYTLEVEKQNQTEYHLGHWNI